MPSSCCVIGCKSRMNAGPKKQFFRFPLNRPKVLQQWLMVLDRLDWVPKPSSKICNEHFSSEDFLFRQNVSVPRLKPEAVPSIFPDPNNTQEEASNEMKSVKPLLNKEKCTIQNQENVNKNSINTEVGKQLVMSPALLTDDVYSKRPKRTSKINVKMKDFIMLDDLRKINKPSPLDTSKTKLGERDETPVKIKLPERLETCGKSNLSEKVNVPHKPISGKDVVVSKVDAAKELLSILEDSDDELNISSQNENFTSKNGDTTEDKNSNSVISSSENKGHYIGKVHSKKDLHKFSKNLPDVVKISQPSVKITEIASKVKAASYLRVGPGKLQELEAAQSVASKALEAVTTPLRKHSLTTKLAHGTMQTISQVSQPQKIISLSDPKDKASDAAETCYKFNDALFKHAAKGSEVMHNSSTSDIKMPMHIRTKRPSTDLAKTYFPIRCGENFFYFSYADLNPVVDLSRHNVLVKEDSNNDPEENIDISRNANVSNKSKAHIKKKFKKKDDTKYIQENKKNRNKEQSECSIVFNVSTDETDISIPAEKDKERNSEVSKVSSDPDSACSQETNISLNDQVEFVSENSMDNLQPLPLENVNVVLSPAKKRKKRFKTVAEIVVRTDNAKPGEVPYVSIDKINKIVDFKTAKPPNVKNVIREKPNHEGTNVVDMNDNLNHITISNDEEPSEEELARLSERITDTVKKMKLLDKVKGNTSKLTVLITTLPPVKEKEILIIKKKNLETNTVQSRELQVVISSNKTNESAIHGNIVVTNPLGYTILPASKTSTSITSSRNDSSAHNSDEGENNCFTPDHEHATIVCFQDKFGSKEISENEFSLTNKDSSSASNENTEYLDNFYEPMSIETGEKDKNSSETIKHDHSYISPNVQYLLSNPNVSLNLAEVQSKETVSKMKLSENEIVFRNKVSKKLRTLKENIKKKNDSIGKLKDKIKFLERTLKEVKRNKKNPVKLLKKESSSLLKNDIFYGVDQLVDTSDFANTIDYSLNNIELPLGLEENAEETEDDDGERECSSPITYLCEPAIEVSSKERETAN